MPGKENNKKRVIVDYKNITQDQLDLLTKAYPFGIDEEDILSFVNSKGETVDTVPLETDDTKYLFKVSVHLDAKIDAHLNTTEDSNIEEISEDQINTEE